MSKYIVSGCVTTVSYDDYEFEIFLQKEEEEREDWTDYDYIIKSKGEKAENLDKILKIGDKISIRLERDKEELK